MVIQKAANGWPGIFLPGDEALGLAHLLRKAADGIENNEVSPDKIAIFLRVTAEELEACKV